MGLKRFQELLRCVLISGDKSCSSITRYNVIVSRCFNSGNDIYMILNKLLNFEYSFDGLFVIIYSKYFWYHNRLRLLRPLVGISVNVPLHHVISLSSYVACLI